MMAPILLRKKFWTLLPGLVVIVLGFAASFALWHHQRNLVDVAAHARFIQEARSFTDSLEHRVAAHTEIANGVKGLFTLNPNVSRREFARVVAELDAGRRYPGIQRIAFLRDVKDQDRDTFEAKVRQDDSLSPEGFPDFEILPKGHRPEYWVIDYQWPYEGYNGDMGIDMLERPEHQKAFEYVKAMARTAISPPFKLHEILSSPTVFAIHSPVFVRSGEGPLAERKFLGTVTATVAVKDLVRAVESEGFLHGIAVRIEDSGSVLDPESDAQAKVLLDYEGQDPHAWQSYEREMIVHDRRWRLTFQPVSNFMSQSETTLPWGAAVGGAILSLVLGALTIVLTRQRLLALHRARRSDAARKDSDKRFRALFNQAAAGVAQIDREQGTFVRVNHKYADLLGYSSEELRGTTFESLSDPLDWPRHQAMMARLDSGELSEYHMEQRLQHRSGEWIWASTSVSPMSLQQGQIDFYISVVQDITERRRMEDTLRDNDKNQREILHRLPVGVCLVKQDGRITFRNERFVQICGYSEEDAGNLEQFWSRCYPDVLMREHMRLAWAAELSKARLGDGFLAPREVSIWCKDGSIRTVELAGVLSGEDILVSLLDMSQRKAAEDEVKYLAFYDSLTQLPNRRLMLDRLQNATTNAVRKKRGGAFLLLDLDNFKTINETQGHDTGDLLLLQVAQRLSSCMRPMDTVARQGGDEFAVLLEDLGSTPQEIAAAAQLIGEEILDKLRRPFRLGDDEYHSTLSMGITLYSGQGEGETVDILLKRADLAMYQAKATGRDSLCFYDESMQEAISTRAALELDMRAAIAAKQFELYLQPQVDNGRITGAEALLRWRHPVIGFVSPAQFIPLAEECGLIHPLGEWVLHEACKRLAQWADDPEFAHLDMAVNVSPRQFHQRGFVSLVTDALASTGANGRRLKLELTEGLLLEDVEDTVSKMIQLKSHGVGFSLDDFGTGYSSLSYLKRLPLDQLKIDQSFVRDVLTDSNDAAIARTIVALGHSLGLRVIAEGVETEAQREFLARNHCHSWQGYLLSPPIPADAYEKMVRSNAEALLSDKV